jgi:putative SOS response-associated peptidase YedK
MCGRYEAGQKQKIAEAFHVSVALDDVYFGPGQECSPGSIQPVIYIENNLREIGEMRWGFKLPDRLLFNARSESIVSSKFWKEMLSKRRCIVPAGSFFEWKKTGPEPRPKYRLTVKGRNVLGMAGIWSPWINPKTGLWENTFAIITTDANVKMGEIHDRQPVILEPREYSEWLNEDERPPVHLLRIMPEEDLVIDPLDVAKGETIAERPEPGLFDGM